MGIRLKDLPQHVQAQLAEQGVKRARSKYGNQPVVIDGFRFDSKREADYCRKLTLLCDEGEVRYFLRQVPFHIPGGIVYRADFMVVNASGDVRFIDAKGFKTKEYAIKKKLVRQHFGIEIQEV